MRSAARVMLLCTAALLCVASAKRTAAVGTGRALQSRPDKQLSHPALHVVNRSAEVVQLALRGPVHRRLLAPPQEHARTLLAAGLYKLEVRRGGRLLKRQQVRLLAGHRYRLEIAP